MMAQSALREGRLVHGGWRHRGGPSPPAPPTHSSPAPKLKASSGLAPHLQSQVPLGPDLQAPKTLHIGRPATLLAILKVGNSPKEAHTEKPWPTSPWPKTQRQCESQS